MKNYIYPILLLLSFIACDDNFSSDTFTLESNKYFIALDKYELTFVANKSQSVTIKTEMPWTLECDAYWLSFDRVNGAKGSKVTISAIPNVLSTSRQATVTIKSNDNKSESATIKVLQDPFSVDLGLSVKWAPMNVGADSPSDYGDYFAWGETEVKDSYDYENYKWVDVSFISFSSMWSNGLIEFDGNLTEVCDAANAKLGDTWRTPTPDEIEELVNLCSWKWTTRDGHSGYEVTGPNGNSIFLPAAGFRSMTSLYSEGSIGLYFGSKVYDEHNVYCISFGIDSHKLSHCGAYSAHSIRPVTK